MVGETDNTDVFQLGVRHTLSRSVRDNALMLSLCEGSGGAAGLQPVGNVEGQSDRRLKIALSTLNLFGEEPDADVKAATEEVARLCEELGHTVELADAGIANTFMTDFLDLWSSSCPGIVSRVSEQHPDTPIEELLEPWTLGLARYFEGRDADVILGVRERFLQAQVALNQLLESYDVWLTPVLAEATEDRRARSDPAVRAALRGGGSLCLLHAATECHRTPGSFDPAELERRRPMPVCGNWFAQPIMVAALCLWKTQSKLPSKAYLSRRSIRPPNLIWRRDCGP